MFIQDLFPLLFLPSSGQYTTEVQGRCSTMTPERQRQREEEEAGGKEWREGKRDRNFRENS